MRGKQQYSYHCVDGEHIFKRKFLFLSLSLSLSYVDANMCVYVRTSGRRSMCSIIEQHEERREREEETNADG